MTQKYVSTNFAKKIKYQQKNVWKMLKKLAKSKFMNSDYSMVFPVPKVHLQFIAHNFFNNV